MNKTKERSSRSYDYHEGDAVRVKAGTACLDATDLDISGWQGRITDLTQAEDESEPVRGEI